LNFRKVLSFALGPIGTAGLGFVTLPIVAWYYGAEDVGRLSMQTIATSFALLFFSLGLDQAYVREFHEEEDKGRLLKATLLPGLVLFGVALPVLAWLSAPVAGLLFGQEDPMLTLLMFVTALSGFITRFLALILRMEERGLAFSLSQVLPKALFLALVALQVLLKVRADFRTLLGATAISALAVPLVYGWNTRHTLRAALRARIDPERLKAMSRYALPLVPGGLAFWGLTAVDRMFLRGCSTLSELAVYSVAANFAAGAAILQSVFGTLWAPTVYRWASQGDCADKVDRAMNHVLFAVILLFCAFGLMAWILPLLLPPQYAPVRYVFIAALAYPLLYTLSETTVVGINLQRRSGLALLASACALAVDVLCDWVLVPRFGASGAAVASTLAFFVFFVVRTEGSAQVWRQFPRTRMYLFVLAIMVTVIASALAQHAFETAATALWLAILISAIAAFRTSLKSASALVATTFAR
jgi:O-antigen/teichoic acid export membrane protein